MEMALDSWILPWGLAKDPTEVPPMALYEKQSPGPSQQNHNRDFQSPRIGALTSQCTRHPRASPVCKGEQRRPSAHTPG